MPYAYFTPSDLREVDPRHHAPNLAADEETVRELLTARMTGDDLTRALQALGLLPYDRMLSTGSPLPGLRSNSTIGTKTDGVHCRNMHVRAIHSKLDKNGNWFCRECRRSRTQVLRDKRKKEAA